MAVAQKCLSVRACGFGFSLFTLKTTNSKSLVQFWWDSQALLLSSKLRTIDPNYYSITTEKMYSEKEQKKKALMVQG